jgi:hypothetical protein
MKGHVKVDLCGPESLGGARFGSHQTVVDRFFVVPHDGVDVKHTVRVESCEDAIHTADARELLQQHATLWGAEGMTAARPLRLARSLARHSFTVTSFHASIKQAPKQPSSNPRYTGLVRPCAMALSVVALLSCKSSGPDAVLQITVSGPAGAMTSALGVTVQVGSQSAKTYQVDDGGAPFGLPTDGIRRALKDASGHAPGCSCA